MAESSSGRNWIEWLGYDATEEDRMSEPTFPPNPMCFFCFRDQHDCKSLVSSRPFPGEYKLQAFICDECVRRAMYLILDQDYGYETAMLPLDETSKRDSEPQSANAENLNPSSTDEKSTDIKSAENDV
jgi:hypothetical protein